MLGLTSMAAAVAVGASAQTAPAAPGVIDTHHHFYPPRYTRENLQRIVADIGVAPASMYLNWSPANAIEKMDQAGIATAINSMSSPGVWFGDTEAGRVWARECNAYGAKMVQDHPGRFGLFAALPLPDIEGSLREIAHAFDMLKADGIGLLTSYAGTLLGDPTFAPVYEELNRRQAIIFVHPTMSCCGNAIPDVASPVIEFPMDSTRTIVSLLMSGTFGRYPQIRFIFSHGGGMLLPVMNRVASMFARQSPEVRAAKAPGGVEVELRRHFYDLASVGFNAPAMEGLRRMLPVSQLLFGSDEPFNSSVQMTRALQGLQLSMEDLRSMRRDNAARLFPRLPG